VTANQGLSALPVLEKCTRYAVAGTESQRWERPGFLRSVEGVGSPGGNRISSRPV